MTSTDPPAEEPATRDRAVEGPSIEGCARLVYERFRRYDADFRRITRRAPRRFVARDWGGAQADREERLELWERSLAATAAALKSHLGGLARNRHVWHRIKEFYGSRVDGFGDAEFARTFFTSVTRRVFDTVGVDPLIEFVLDLEPVDHRESLPGTRIYVNWGRIEELFHCVLDDFAFSVAWEDADRDVRVIVDAVSRKAWRHYRHPNTLLRVELLEPVFYQSTRAFLVGKVEGEGWVAPFAIGFEHRGGGIALEKVYMSHDDITILLGFTRSYFFVDLDTVSSAVHYLMALLPDKPVDEFYSVLGRIRQGKTERYRHLARHLQGTEERFEPAPGTKGMVMIVFTLPSYHLVFKVIRDRFGPAKKVTRRQVIERYRLVSRHDRVGRLIDTQAFRHLAFPRERFAPDLLAELAEEAGTSVRIEDGHVVFEHIYLERKVRPLNLYLQEVGWRQARAVVADYGQAIKDMAMTNIFPGDMLLKNFGVTRHGRVIFYDFDEVTLLTDCRFRATPLARDELLDFADETWFEVSDGDVFPDRFGSFLGLGPELAAVFMQRHADLLDPAFWRRMQARHATERDGRGSRVTSPGDRPGPGAGRSGLGPAPAPGAGATSRRGG